MDATTTATGAPAYSIRDGAPTDWPFVVKTWVGEYVGGGEHSRAMREKISAYCYPIVQRIVRRAAVRVACDWSAPEVIFGFRVSEPNALHLVYVRPALRGNGIGRSLMAGMDLRRVVYTTATAASAGWIHEKYPHILHVPFWMEPASSQDIAALIVEGHRPERLWERARKAKVENEAAAV